MTTSADSGFTSLWPTLFLQRTIPAHQEPNNHLHQYLLEQESAQKNYTTNYVEQDLFTQKHPAIDWLRACLNKTVVDYLHQQKLGYSVNWTLQAWANINRKGDYHSLHNHPHSYLSGTYYISVPEQVLKPTLRRDLNPGAISFFDPRAQANMNAIAGDGQIEAEHRVDPESGMILLWPSFLHHFVHPNLSDELRISVSFNVVLKWSDEYRPKQ